MLGVAVLLDAALARLVAAMERSWPDDGGPQVVLRARVPQFGRLVAVGGAGRFRGVRQLGILERRRVGRRPLELREVGRDIAARDLPRRPPQRALSDLHLLYHLALT